MPQQLCNRKLSRFPSATAWQGAVERIFVHIFTPSHYDRASLVVLHRRNLCRHAPRQVTQSNSQY